MLTFDQFAERVLTRIHLEDSLPANPYDGIHSELGLDSLQGYELIVVVEALAGADLYIEVPEITTMQDAYEYFCHLCTLRLGDS